MIVIYKIIEYEVIEKLIKKLIKKYYAQVTKHSTFQYIQEIQGMTF